MKGTTEVQEDQKEPLLPASRRQPRLQCRLPQFAAGCVYFMTFPQGPLGSLLLYDALASQFGDGIAVQVVSWLVGIPIGAIIIRARGKVLTPLVANKFEEIKESLSCRSVPTETSIQEQKAPKKISPRRWLFNSTNLVFSSNVSMVFASMNLSGCDEMGSKIFSMLGSLAFKILFSMTSLTVNILIFYDTQKFLFMKFNEQATALSRWSSEEPTVYNTRRRLLKSLQAYRQEVVGEINQYLRESGDLDLARQFDTDFFQTCSRALEQKDFNQFQQLVPKLKEINLEGLPYPSSNLPIRYYFYAGSAWLTAMVGIWDFYYLQISALEFMLEDIGELSSDSAEDLVFSYTYYIGSYILMLNMSAFYGVIVGDGAMHFLTRHHEINLDAMLSRWHWPKIFLLAVIASLPNLSIGIQSLPSGVTVFSILGMGMVVLSLIGPTLMEILGLNFSFRLEALEKFKQQRPQDAKIFELPAAISDCRQKITALSPADIKSMNPFRETVPEEPQRHCFTRICTYLRNSSLFQRCLGPSSSSTVQPYRP